MQIYMTGRARESYVDVGKT